MKRMACAWFPDLAAGSHKTPASQPDPWPALLELAHQMSPTAARLATAGEEFDYLVLDATTAPARWGGEEPWARDLFARLQNHNRVVRLAVADTLGAAWAIAHAPARNKKSWCCVVPSAETLAHLEPLPLATLRLSSPTLAALEKLGLETIGQLFQLPAAQLAARFPPELLQRLDQARGLLPEVIAAELPPPVLLVQEILPVPTDGYEHLQQVLARLLERLLAQLAPWQGIERLSCWLQEEGNGPPLATSASSRSSRKEICLQLGLFRPTAQLKHLQELLEMQLELQRLSAPVAAMRLEVQTLGRLSTRQTQLFTTDRQHSWEELTQLIDRLGCRLGRDRILRARLLSEAQPEYAFRYEPLVGPGAWRQWGRTVGEHKPAFRLWQRPLQFFRPPIPLEVQQAETKQLVPRAIRWEPPTTTITRGATAATSHTIAQAWGPERIETGWWRRGRLACRDYFRIETTTGSWFWIFYDRRQRRWFLQGSYA